jgi:hypothetical protein
MKVHEPATLGRLMPLSGMIKRAAIIVAARLPF